MLLRAGRPEPLHPPRSAADWERWKGFVERVGGRLLSICERWLIAIEGNGAPDQWCWGEYIGGQAVDPIQLPVAHRLVMAPHTYGDASTPRSRTHITSLHRAAARL